MSPSINGYPLRSPVPRLLTEAWREDPIPDYLSSEELTRALPLLLGSGAGALSWFRIQHSKLVSCSAAFKFQQAYRHHTLEAARHERDIRGIFSSLRSTGIEPILIKDWSIARLYPERGLRPYDDTDLVVRGDQYENAQAIAQEQ